MKDEFDHTTDESKANKQNHYIPILLLPNARDILNEFNDSIERITAAGTGSDTDTTTRNKDYGFKVEETYSTRVSINYNRKKNTKGEVLNPITKQKAQNINSEIHQTIQTMKQGGKNITYDIPVSEVIVEIEDGRLNWKYEDDENVEPDDSFFFIFQLNQIEEFAGNLKDIIEPKFEERHLPQQGFNWRLPVLQEIVPKRGFDFDGDDHNSVFSWSPENTNTEPLSTSASQMIAGMLPNKIAHSNKVAKGREDYWLL